MSPELREQIIEKFLQLGYWLDCEDDKDTYHQLSFAKTDEPNIVVEIDKR